MIYLTILNTLLIVYLITAKKSKYYLKFGKETTTYENTLLGFRLRLWKKEGSCSASSKHSIYFKIRDIKKTEMQEEARMMIANYSQWNKLQSLSAKFSWLKTWEEVKEFEKYYTCVDQKIVEDLVVKFVPKVF